MAYKTVKEGDTLYAMVPVAQAPKAAEEGAKPGWKTTEFWVTVATSIAGLLAMAGVIKPEQASAIGSAAPQLSDLLLQAVGLITALGASFGYSMSRGKAKGK